ncbi:MAG TPA: type II toxin-antitoxin system VapC family toxin [Gemmata sp.]|jgi:tRNA(fMet)-specific endonuclease VapC|nr:type II toxin-antitoxin system VapC family toxin [Gemmata sp.]
MMFLLDTDVATLAYHNQPNVLGRIQTATRPVCLPIVTRLELLRGRIEAVIKSANVQELLRAEDTLAKTEAFCSGFKIVAIGTAAAEFFVRLRSNKRVKKMGRGDLLNASISLANNATLVTRNLKDYASVPGLKLENWAD